MPLILSPSLYERVEIEEGRDENGEKTFGGSWCSLVFVLPYLHAQGMMKKSTYTEKASTHPEAPDFDFYIGLAAFNTETTKSDWKRFLFPMGTRTFATHYGFRLRGRQELSPQSNFEGVGVRRNTVIYCLYPENLVFCEPIPLSSQNMIDLRSGGLAPGHPILAVTFSQDFQISSSPR